MDNISTGYYTNSYNSSFEGDTDHLTDYLKITKVSDCFLIVETPMGELERRVKKPHKVSIQKLLKKYRYLKEDKEGERFFRKVDTIQKFRFILGRKHCSTDIWIRNITTFKNDKDFVKEMFEDQEKRFPDIEAYNEAKNLFGSV